MINNRDDIKFYTDNILGSDFSNWNKTNSVVSGNYVSIAPGGNIYLDILDELKIKASMYTRVDIKASGDISDINNYKSGLDIKIVEVYKVGDSIKKRTRSLGITPFSASVDTNIYSDTTLLNMLNQDMKKYSISIINNSTSELKVYSIGVYRSQDVDTSQLYEAQKEVSNTYGLIIPVLDIDPVNPILGQVWIRGDL